MSLDYQCGDPSALAGYLYDECEPDERRAIEAHLAVCATCAEEVQALRATRAQLACWAPPNGALGFQVVASSRTPAPEPAPVLTSPRWWHRPLPAWAQAAAAVLIFTSGALMGLGVTRPSAPPGSVAASVGARPADAPVTTMAVSPADLTEHDMFGACSRESLEIHDSRFMIHDWVPVEIKNQESRIKNQESRIADRWKAGERHCVESLRHRPGWRACDIRRDGPAGLASGP